MPVEDKDVLYSMLSRELENILGGTPILAAFSGVIEGYIIRLIDPYVSAFIDSTTSKLNTKQLSAFAVNEVEEKINKFKKQYDELEKKGGVNADENKTNI